MILKKRYGIAANTKEYGMAHICEYKGTAVNTGNFGYSISVQDKGIALNTGYGGCAIVCGRSGIAVTTGSNSYAIVKGENSVAFANGRNAMVGGAKGTFLICADYGKEENGKLRGIQVYKVDGEIIRENMLYSLQHGYCKPIKKVSDVPIAKKTAVEAKQPGKISCMRWINENIRNQNACSSRYIQNTVLNHEILSTGRQSICFNRNGEIQSNGAGSVGVQDSCYPGNISSVLGQHGILIHKANLGTAFASGWQTIVIRNGYEGSAVACGEDAVAAILGKGCKVKGMLGTYLVAAEYGAGEYIKDIKAKKVEGKEILPDMYYVLRGGKFIEAWKNSYTV